MLAFMRELPVRKVNGVGRVFERELEAIGISTCGHIYEQRACLAKLFGDKAFHFLINCHLGLGRTRIQPSEDLERKSVGTESTFGDKSGATELRNQLRWTADELEKDLARTQFKGRTLVLKVKLHTYEVLSRQVRPPKAVYRADDLYNYALPMLSRLEKDMPGMRLRLMGLRLTHLVSTNRDVQTAFFGPVRQDSGDSLVKRKASVLDDDGTRWEAWPEAEFEEAAREERQSDQEHLEKLSQELLEQVDRRRRHGKEIVPNPRRRDTSADEFWDCPVCLRPQPAKDMDFNRHMDFCLSRQTIKEAIGDTPDIGHSRNSPLDGAIPGTASKASKRQRFFS